MSDSVTYAKLRDGSWGVRVTGSVREGQVVTVRKRDGSTKSETIAKVVWSSNGVSLCSIVARQPQGRSRRGGGCHTDGNCSSVCNPKTCPCGNGTWFSCC